MVKHHSVRKYHDEPVSEEDLQAITAAALSAPTSSNQNSWSVVVVRDPYRKRSLMRATGKNSFIDQAPVFMVWIADLSRAHRLAEREGRTYEALLYQEALLVGFVDAALAAQNAAVAAESLGLGTCYVGGIRTNIEEVCQILHLPAFAVPAFGLTIGWPADNGGVKPRLPLSSVCFDEVYDSAAADQGIKTLESETREYFATQGYQDISWTQKALSRWENAASLGNRRNNREVIQGLGLADM